MNRPIKFRAWDDVEKKMYSATDIFNPVNGIWYEDDQDGTLAINKIMDSYGIRRELIKMQFTGIVDKNNKEIYDGDILKVKCINSYDFVSEVGFDAGCFVIFPKEIKKQQPVWFVNTYSEIIGNIFENPELLK